MTLAFVMPGLDEAASEKAIAILQNLSLIHISEPTRRN